MIFSTKNIIESSNNTLPNYNNIEEENNYDYNYFSEALTMILDEQLVFESNLAIIDEGIVGSIAKHMVNKQIDKIKHIDLEQLLLKLINWFCEAIKKMNGIFLAALTKFINANHRINMFKAKLMDFQEDIIIKSNFELYEYSFNDNSYSTFKSDVNNQFNELVEELSRIKRAKNAMELESIVSNMSDNSSNLELDNIRGNSIGSNRLISREEYPDALFAYFRSGKSEPYFTGGITIPNSTYKNYCTDYFNYRNLEKKIKAESRKVESDTKELKSRIKEFATPALTTYVTNGTELSANIKKQFNEAITNRCKNVQEICNIYVLLYSAKLDALKEYNILCKNVLLRAIDEIAMKEGAKGNGK